MNVRRLVEDTAAVVGLIVLLAVFGFMLTRCYS